MPLPMPAVLISRYKQDLCYLSLRANRRRSCRSCSTRSVSPGTGATGLPSSVDANTGTSQYLIGAELGHHQLPCIDLELVAVHVRMIGAQHRGPVGLLHFDDIALRVVGDLKDLIEQRVGLDLSRARTALEIPLFTHRPGHGSRRDRA
jgi:hypothetical protein